MAALGLDSKLDRAPELLDVPWPSSAAYAGAQVLVAELHLKSTIKERVLLGGSPSIITVRSLNFKFKRNSNANREGCFCHMYLSRKLWRVEFTCDLSLAILCM
jgi:hypothetical protein